MRAVLQRVSRAEVTVGGRAIGRIGRGFVVLLGVARGDSDDDAAFVADRVVGLRVFADHEGKMNLNIHEVGGSMLVVSQFTLIADTDGGRRPSFSKAAPADEARRLYERFISLISRAGVKVEQGEFGANMQLSLTNDGPVTIILDNKIR